MNLEMVSLKDLCESEEFLRRDFEYVFFTLVVFLFNPFSFRRVGEFWVERGEKKSSKFFLSSFAARAAHLSKNARRLVRLTNFSNVGVSY